MFYFTRERETHTQARDVKRDKVNYKDKYLDKHGTKKRQDSEVKNYENNKDRDRDRKGPIHIYYTYVRTNTHT